MTTDCANATLLPYTLEQQIFNLYLTAPLALTGIVGNIYCLCLLQVEHLPLRSVRPIIEVTCVVDTLILISSLCMFSVPTAIEMVWDPALVPGWLAFAKAKVMVNFYPIALTARTVSTWLSIFATLLRFLAVRYPYKMTELSTERTGVWVRVIWGLAIVYNIPRWFELTVATCVLADGRPLFFTTVSMLRTIHTYKVVYLGGLYSTFMLFLPVSAVLLTNIAISMTAAKMRRAVGEESRSISKTQELVITDMALMMGREFLVCSMLACVNNVLEILLDNEVVSVTHAAGMAYAYLVPITNVTVLLNAMSNTFMYLWFSRKYEKLMAGNLYVRLEGVSYAATLLLPNLNAGDDNSTIASETTHLSSE